MGVTMNRNVIKEIDLYANESIEKSCDSYNEICFNNDQDRINMAVTMKTAMLNLQLLPYKSFDDPRVIFDLSDVHNITSTFDITATSHREIQFITEGFVEIVDKSFLRISQKGIFEYVTIKGFHPNDNRSNFMIGIVEPLIIKALEMGFACMKNLKVPTPVILKVGVTQCMNYNLYVDDVILRGAGETMTRLSPHPINSNAIISNPIWIDDFDGKLDEFLLGIFNKFWNAGGYPKSLNYDDNGEYIVR